MGPTASTTTTSKFRFCWGGTRRLHNHRLEFRNHISISSLRSLAGCSSSVQRRSSKFCFVVPNASYFRRIWSFAVQVTSISDAVRINIYESEAGDYGRARTRKIQYTIPIFPLISVTTGGCRTELDLGKTDCHVSHKHTPRP